jgi:ABC-type transporter Mla MlaB component
VTIRFGAEVGPETQAASLALTGELDQAGVAELESVFRALADHAHVVIDVSALEFCDSAGWHALQRCSAAGATLLGSPRCLRRLFYLIQHAHLLPPELHELRGLEQKKELLDRPADAA